MISIELSAKGKRNTIIVDENKTVADVLNENGVDYRVSPPLLDGQALDFDEINSTFAQLGVNKTCLLTCVVKTSNA